MTERFGFRLSAFALSLSIVLSSLPALAAPEKYYVPPAQCNAALQVSDRGFSNAMGLFQNATGAFTFDAETKTISNLRVAIDAGTLMMQNQGMGRELDALLAVRTYPEISFMATAPTAFKDGRAEIKGTLSVHGQKKDATFEGTLNNVGNNRTDDKAVGLSLRGAFKRADYGMGDEPEMPGRFGDTITLMLEMQAIRP